MVQTLTQIVGSTENSGKRRWDAAMLNAFVVDVANGLSADELATKYKSSRGAMKRRMVPIDAKLRRLGDFSVGPKSDAVRMNQPSKTEA